MATVISLVKGLGLCPAGQSYAGFGSVATEAETNRQDLIIDEGPLKGQIGDCRLIDPVTQDYRYNSNGYMVGGIGIQQKVYLALLTVKGSSAQLNLGQSFSNVKVIGTNFLQQITSEVNNALSDLISKKQISLNAVVPIRDPISNTMIRIDIQWTDLISGTDLTSTI